MSLAKVAGVLRIETWVLSGNKMKAFIGNHFTFGCEEAIDLSQEASIEAIRVNSWAFR